MTQSGSSPMFGKHGGMLLMQSGPEFVFASGGRNVKEQILKVHSRVEWDLCYLISLRQVVIILKHQIILTCFYEHLNLECLVTTKEEGADNQVHESSLRERERERISYSSEKAKDLWGPFLLVPRPGVSSLFYSSRFREEKNLDWKPSTISLFLCQNCFIILTF